MSKKSTQRKEKATVSSWRIFAQSLPTGFAMIKAVLKHPNEAIQMMGMAQAAKRRAEAKKEKPDRPYDIPPYQEGMPHCRSDEVYLRPTRLIETDAPEIIAMANQLGAFQKSDREYANACFDFLKKKVQFSFAAPLRGAVGSLEAGEGVCFDKVHLFIALCRAGGIPARLKCYNTAFAQDIYQPLTESNTIMKELYDSMGYFLMHTMAEAFVEGKWEPADFSQDIGYEAALGHPLAHFGDDPNGVWNWEVPGSTMRLAELPLLFALSVAVALKMNRGFMFLIQEGWGEGLEQGKRILEEMGEEEYDKRARQTYKMVLPEVSKKLFKALQEAEPAVSTEAFGALEQAK